MNLNSTNELLDLENRQRAERLQAKVSQLKHFALDIENETKEHNRLLDDTSYNFEGVFGYLSTSKTKLTRLLNSNRKNRKLVFYFVIILIFFLFMIYCLLTRSLKFKEV